MINVDECIKFYTKKRNKTALEAYKALKTEILKYKTAKNAKPYDEFAEIKLIKKIISEITEEANCYFAADRDDVAVELMERTTYLESLIPEPPSQQEIKDFIHLWIGRTPGCESSEKLIIPKKLMGAAIKATQNEFPTADGKDISDLIKTYII